MAKNEDNLDQILRDMKKEYGEGAVIHGSKTHIESIPRWEVSSPSISYVLGGGVPRGRIIEMYGVESCVSGDTHIPYKTVNPETGFQHNGKGGTIRRLYERFHKIETGKPGEKLREETKNAHYYVSSVNEKNCIVNNQIVDVVKTGTKPVYELTTQYGKKIKATTDHKFFTDRGYYPLDSLSIGDTIYISKGDRFTKEEKKQHHHLDKCVRYHPSEHWHKVTANNKRGEKVYAYDRCRVRESRLVYEAYQNEMTYDEYVNVLNTKCKEEIDKLWTIPEGYHIHHIDEDTDNNSIENLEMIHPSIHNSYHAKENHNYMRFIVTEDRIESIEYVGEDETFDIKCIAPYHNYIADGIVVHNCGKTSLSVYLGAEVQRQGGNVLYVDFENALDMDYAETFGFDRNKCFVSQPDSGEEGLNIIHDFCERGAVDYVIVDSVSAITPLAEIEGGMEDQQMGIQARLMGKALRKIAPLARENGVTICFINQLRQAIGVMYGNPERTSGGQALKYWASIRLDIRRKEYIIENKTNYIGLISRIKSIKNKTAPPMRQAEVQIIFGEGFQYETEYVDFAISHGIVRKSGPWYYITNREGEEAHKSQGKDGVVTYLRENPDMFDFIKEQVKAVMGLETSSSPVVYSEEEGGGEEESE